MKYTIYELSNEPKIMNSVHVAYVTDTVFTIADNPTRLALRSADSTL